MRCRRISSSSSRTWGVGGVGGGGPGRMSSGSTGCSRVGEMQVAGCQSKVQGYPNLGTSPHELLRKLQGNQRQRRRQALQQAPHLLAQRRVQGGEHQRLLGVQSIQRRHAWGKG